MAELLLLVTLVFGPFLFVFVCGMATILTMFGMLILLYSSLSEEERRAIREAAAGDEGENNE